jgi:hypothetical protein
MHLLNYIKSVILFLRCYILLLEIGGSDGGNTNPAVSNIAVLGDATPASAAFCIYQYNHYFFSVFCQDLELHHQKCNGK